MLLGIYQKPLWSQCPDRISIATRLTALKIAGINNGDQLKELKGYLPLIEKCPVKNDTVQAYLLQRIGALYSLENDYKSAVAWSRRSIDIANANLPTVSRSDFLIKVYNYLQMFYDSLNMPRQKMEAIDSCIHLAMQSDRVNNDVIFNVWQRVDYCLDIGDYQRCADYSKMGEDITRYCDNNEDSLVYAASFFNLRINSLILMSRFEEAETILQKRINEHKKRKDEKNCGVYYNQLAEISTQKQEYDKSLFFLSRSLKWNKAIHRQLYCKQTYNNIGFLYQSRLNIPDSALPYFRAALNCRNEVVQDNVMDAIETLNIYDNIANVFAFKNKFDSAYFYYQKAFNQLRPGIDEQTVLNFSADEFIANKKMQYLTGLIKDKGDAHLLEYSRSGDMKCLKRAIGIYKIASLVLTRVKTEQAESISGIAWRGNARNLYEKAIEACFMLRDADNAFYFFEKSRAVLLNDLITNKRHSSMDEIKIQVRLKRKLGQLQNRLNAIGHSSAQYRVLQKDIYAVTQENDLVSLNIKKRDPLYYRSYIDTAFISLSLFKKNVFGKDQSLLEIFYGDSAVYVLLISGKFNRLLKINKEKYDRLTQAYTRYISDPILLNSHYDEFIKTAGNLYSLLVNQLPAGTRLIISPDGQYFPFEALVSDIKTPRFLIYDHAISYAYSAGYLSDDVSSDKKNTPAFLLGMAPVHFASSLQLPDLPASDQSLRSISSLFTKTNEFINASATRANFLNNFFNYTVVQLYTHGSSGVTSGEPEIYFADSSLRLSDIDPVYKPATELIVLSACETGNGVFYKGEGVFSFNRAFASIGIPSSLVNLWSVDNKAVYALTELFYKYVAMGLPLDISLQKAKIEYMQNASRDRAMPYYWAPAIIFGKTGALVTTSSPLSWKWALLIIIPMILVTGYKYRNRFKRFP